MSFRFKVKEAKKVFPFSRLNVLDKTLLFSIMITSAIMAKLSVSYLRGIKKLDNLIIAIMIYGPNISKFVFFIFIFVIESTIFASLIKTTDPIIKVALIANFIVERFLASCAFY